MSELSARKVNSSESRRVPKTKVEDVSTKGHTNLVSLERLRLLKHVGLMCSFTSALKFASNQNQWSLGDRAFLMTWLSWLQEQLSSWEQKLTSKAEQLNLENSCHAKLNIYGKEVAHYVDAAILAVNTANSNQLALALEVINNKLKLMLEVFHNLLAAESI